MGTAARELRDVQADRGDTVKKKRKKPLKVRRVGKDQLIRLKRIVPNTWNPNRMSPMEYAKTKQGIVDLLEAHDDDIKKLPSILTRPHPEKKGYVQVIDGEHRWRIMQELGYDRMPCDVIDVDTALAMRLTSQLNWNRGSPDPLKYPMYLAQVVQFADGDLDYLSERLPESSDEMRDILDSMDLDIEVIDIESEASGEKLDDVSQKDVWVKATFDVSRSQAEIIEAEIARIMSTLDGKNKRGRALEYMAVLSSQTPLDVPEEKPRKKKRKKKRSDE